MWTMQIVCYRPGQQYTAPWGCILTMFATPCYNAITLDNLYKFKCFHVLCSMVMAFKHSVRNCANYLMLLDWLECYTLNRTRVRMILSVGSTVNERKFQLNSLLTFCLFKVAIPNVCLRRSFLQFGHVYPSLKDVACDLSWPRLGPKVSNLLLKWIMP